MVIFSTTGCDKVSIVVVVVVVVVVVNMYIFYNLFMILVSSFSSPSLLPPPPPPHLSSVYSEKNSHQSKSNDMCVMDISAKLIISAFED